MTFIVSCGGPKEKGQVLDLKLTPSSTLSGSVWYLYTYGKSKVTVDTLGGKRLSLKQAFERDSTDLFLLLDSAGYVVMPIFPDTLPVIKVRLGDRKEVLSGMLEADIWKQWRAYRLNADSVITEEMINFADSLAQKRVGIFLTQDAIDRYPKSTANERLKMAYSKALGSATDLADVLGLEMSDEYFESYRRDLFFPYMIREKIGKKKELTTHDIIDKKKYMAVAILDMEQLDSLQYKMMDDYFSVLDSLKIPSLTSILFTDTLPNNWKERKEDKTRPARYFEPDSIGGATEILKELPLDSLPSYMVVDSNLMIIKIWSHPDSLIHYVKDKEAPKKKKEKSRS